MEGRLDVCMTTKSFWRFQFHLLCWTFHGTVLSSSSPEWCLKKITPRIWYILHLHKKKTLSFSGLSIPLKPSPSFLPMLWKDVRWVCYFNFNFTKLASDILPSQPRKGNLGNPTSSVSFWGSKSIFICIAASEVDTWCYLFVRHTWYVTIIWSGDSKSKCLKRMSASVFTTCCNYINFQSNFYDIPTAKFCMDPRSTTSGAALNRKSNGGRSLNSWHGNWPVKMTLAFDYAICIRVTRKHSKDLS